MYASQWNPQQMKISLASAFDLQISLNFILCIFLDVCAFDFRKLKNVSHPPALKVINVHVVLGVNFLILHHVLGFAGELKCSNTKFVALYFMDFCFYLSVLEVPMIIQQ